MHAELLARQVAGRERRGACTTRTPAAPRAVAARSSTSRSPRRADELLADADVDAVAICTSTDTHAELIVAAARAGKAIFCEKPVSLDLAEVDRALAAVEEAGVPFQIGFNRRFDPAHQSVRDAVASGAVGDVAPRADLEPRPRAAAARLRARRRAGSSST